RAPRALHSFPTRRSSDLASACASVLQQMNSTPWTPDWIMWATALPPAPPTPTTLITVPFALVSSISKFIIIGLLHIYPRIVMNRSEEHTSELQSRENLVC